MGTDRDRIVLHTFSDGMAARASHDLWESAGAMGKPEPGEPEAGGATGARA